MYAATTSATRLATHAAAVALARPPPLAGPAFPAPNGCVTPPPPRAPPGARALHAAPDAKPPHEGTVPAGDLRGAPVAPLSLGDDRTIAHPFRPTAHQCATLRVRAR